MDVFTFTMGFILVPFTFIDISISMDQSSIAIRHVLKPETFIDRPVIPYLFAFPIS